MGLLSQVNSIVIEAGRKALDVYGQDIEVELKGDKSPVTLADKLSHQIIVERLNLISSFPVISEEGELFSVSDHSRHWLVDPLDGTKDFLAKTGDFTVNVALIENGKTILGVVYAPAKDLLFSAQLGSGSFCNEEKMTLSSPASQPFKAVVSHFHINKATESANKELGIVDVEKVGSSLKICRLAQGDVHFYPRLAPTMYWDTAAAQIVLEEAGGLMWGVETQESLSYQEDHFKNPSFIAFHPDLKEKLQNSWEQLKINNQL